MDDLNLDIFNLFDTQPEPSRGSLLVAKPTVEDLCFKRSVTILVDHDNEDGSMGVIVNKPTRFLLNEVIPEIRKVAKKNKLTVIDLHSLFKNDDGKQIQGDGIHPNDAGALQLADIIYQVLTGKEKR